MKVYKSKTVKCKCGRIFTTLLKNRKICGRCAFIRDNEMLTKKGKKGKIK